MGSRNRFNKRTKKKEEDKKKYTTRAGRGSNRVAKVKVPDHIGMTKGKTYGNPNPSPKLTENQKLARSDRKMDRTPKPTPTKKPAPTKAKPAAKKPAYNTPSTTKGPTKSGNYIASKGSSTKGGPTADGKTYKNQIKSKRLRDALSNLKVRKYKK